MKTRFFGDKDNFAIEFKFNQGNQFGYFGIWLSGIQIRTYSELMYLYQLGAFLDDILSEGLEKNTFTNYTDSEIYLMMKKNHTFEGIIDYLYYYYVGHSLGNETPIYIYCYHKNEDIIFLWKFVKNSKVFINYHPKYDQKLHKTIVKKEVVVYIRKLYEKEMRDNDLW